MTIRLSNLITGLVFAGVLAGAGIAAAHQTEVPEPTADPLENVDLMRPDVLAEFPHDSDAFTQGLLLYDGFLYESAGRYEQSTLRRVDPESGEVLQMTDVPPEFFAEGLALVDDRLLQITWQEQTAFAYDRDSFELLDEFTYEGEGWGLCYDGEQLYMSDGSPFIYTRDPETFELTGNVMVTFGGEPIPMINELECVDDSIYANVWQTDYIIRVDKVTGEINGLIDASNLLTPAERAQLQPGAVLNGIAYDAENETFFITGKLWDRIFEVQFVPLETS